MDGYEKIAVVDNQFEAQLLAEILVERRIPHTLKSYYDAAYDGLFQMQKGWGAVYAPPEHKDEIVEIIASLRTEAPARRIARPSRCGEVSCYLLGKGRTVSAWTSAPRSPISLSICCCRWRSAIFAAGRRI